MYTWQQELDLCANPNMIKTKHIVSMYNVKIWYIQCGAHSVDHTFFSLFENQLSVHHCICFNAVFSFLLRGIFSWKCVCLLLSFNGHQKTYLFRGFS